MLPVATCLLFYGMYVYVLGTLTGPAKMAELIETPFGREADSCGPKEPHIRWQIPLSYLCLVALQFYVKLRQSHVTF